MLGFVFSAIAVLILAILVVGAVMVLDMTLGDGERVAAAREETERRWRPPYVSGVELMRWARSVATRSVEKTLGDGADETTAGRLLSNMHEGVSHAMLPDLPRLDAERPVPCPEPGQGVIRVSVPEAIGVADHLRRSMTAAARRRLRDRSEEYAGRIADGLIRGSGVPCSLQDDDCMCGAYSVRPLACRPLHAAIIANGLGSYAEQVACEPSGWAAHTDLVGMGIAEGLTQGLEAAGLDGRQYELHGALVTALDNPDAAERWANGEDLFSRCRFGEAGAPNGLSVL